MINGVKVFFANRRDDRNCLGEKVTDWLSKNRDKQLVDIVVTQSSDEAYHCLSITVFYHDPAAARRKVG